MARKCSSRTAFRGMTSSSLPRYRTVLVITCLLLSIVSAVDWGCNRTSGEYTQLTDCTAFTEVKVSGDLNVTGNVQGYTKLVAAPGQRHFEVGEAATLTLKWLNMSGGTPVSSGTGGSISVPGKNGITLIIHNCIFHKNKAKDSGGAIHAQGDPNYDYGSLILVNTIFLQNEAKGGGTPKGGGIYATYFSVNGAGVQFIKNDADGQGGGFWGGFSSGSTWSDCLIESNTAKNKGGGFYLENGEHIITRTTFEGNAQTTVGNGDHFGGGLYIGGGGTTKLSLRECNIVKNTGRNYKGKQIYAESGNTVTLVNTNIVSDYISDAIEGSRKSCADNPCTVQPYTGECEDIDAHRGVFCKYIGSAVCPKGQTGRPVKPEDNKNTLPPADPCTVCPINTYASEAGNRSCTACVPGKFTRLYSQIVHRDHESDCMYSVCILVGMSPAILEPGRRTNVTLNCSEAMPPNAQFKVFSTPVTSGQYEEWTHVTRSSQATITATVPLNLSGTGHNLYIMMDGILSQMLNFSFCAPNVTKIDRPRSLAGGAITIHGHYFGIRDDHIKVEVKPGDGCEVPCEDPKLDGGNITCQMKVAGSYNTKMKVVVRVGPTGYEQRGNNISYEYPYVGDIIGIPLTTQKQDEGSKTFTYEIKLTLQPENDVTVVFHSTSTTEDNCTVTPLTLTFTKDTWDQKQEVNVHLNNNYVDEGSEIAYTCNVEHKIDSIDPLYNDSSPEPLTIAVRNNDEAGVTILTEDERHSVKFLAVFLQEGEAMKYKVKLNSKPLSTVAVKPTPNISDGFSYQERLTLSPRSVVFNGNNWNIAQLITVNAVEDDIDHDLLELDIYHEVHTIDSVFRNTKDINTTMIQCSISDDDKAGYVATLDDTKVNEEEGSGKGVAIISVAGLLTEPLFDVSIYAQISPDSPTTTEIVGSNHSIITKGNWNRAIEFKIKVGDAPRDTPETSFVTLRAESRDKNYNGTTKTKYIRRLPKLTTPERPTVRRAFKGNLIDVKAEWGDPKEKDPTISYEIQHSEDKTFPTGNKTTTQKVNATNILIRLTKSMASASLYLRARALKTVLGEELKSAWSDESEEWTISSDCDFTREYIDTKDQDPAKWKCQPCPEGAFCEGTDVTWAEVKAKFGWWRITSAPAFSNFSRCLFPPACLGASNPVFRGKFVNASNFDPSMVNSPEQCALRDGYAQACDGDGSPRCRLCATCANGYRRRVMGSMARCDKCPKPTENRLKIAGGGALAMILLACLVRANLGSGGKRTMAEIMQIIVLDYLQLSSLVVSMDVPWPGVLQVVFNIQGVISTIGEHLLSPDCELTNLRPADVVYQKQMAYLLLPFLAILCSWVFWRVVCHCKGHKWTSGEPSYEDKHTSTVIFLLYLLYPTMCNSGFTLLRSETVDGRSFLYADLQEPYMEGRHLSYVLLLSGPQLAFVFGLPILGLKVIWGHKKAQTLSHIKTQFRYGMLYSGYQYKCWWWDMVVAYRKLAISLVTTLAPDEVEIHLLIFVLVLAQYLNQQWRPYTDEEAPNRQERESLHNMAVHSMAIVFGTAWSGFYFKLLPHCENSKWSCTMLTVVVALGNAAFLTYCLLRLAYPYCRERMPDVEKHKKRAKAYFRRQGKQIVLQKAEPNPMAEAAFENPMYRAKRKSTMKTSMQAKRLEMRKIRDALEDRA